MPEIGDRCEMLVNNGSSSAQKEGSSSSLMATADEGQMAVKVSTPQQTGGSRSRRTGQQTRAKQQ